MRVEPELRADGRSAPLCQMPVCLRGVGCEMARRMCSKCRRGERDRIPSSLAALARIEVVRALVGPHAAVNRARDTNSYTNDGAAHK